MFAHTADLSILEAADRATFESADLATLESVDRSTLDSAERGFEQFAFDFLPHSPVVVQPHPGQLTSDAGLLAFRQFDHRWRYSARLAACLEQHVRESAPPSRV